MKLLYTPWHGGAEAVGCVFFHQPQQARLYDFLFSGNVTFVDRGQTLFLRGFVISCHLVKCCKSLHSKEIAM